MYVVMSSFKIFVWKPKGAQNLKLEILLLVLLQFYLDLILLFIPV